MTETLEEKSLHSHRGAVLEKRIIREAQTTEQRNGIIHRAGITGKKRGNPSLLTRPAKEERTVRTFVLAFVELAPGKKSRPAISQTSYHDSEFWAKLRKRPESNKGKSEKVHFPETKSTKTPNF